MTCYPGLQAAVSGLRYQPGWRFLLTSGPTAASSQAVVEQLAGPVATTMSAGGTAILAGPVFLHVILWTADSGNPDQRILVEHGFPVPSEPGPGGWPRWLLERIMDVHRHEAMEAFEVGGVKLFYPEHGPGARLYEVAERAAW